MDRIHPGELLLEELAARNTTSAPGSLVAAWLSISEDEAQAIFMAEQDITPEQAEELGRQLGTSADVWINLQAGYDQKE